MLGGSSLFAVFPLFANGVQQARQEKDETKRGREPQQHSKSQSARPWRLKRETNDAADSHKQEEDTE
jgi:hypothetical protein